MSFLIIEIELDRDHSHHACFQLNLGEQRRVEAAAHGSGLIIATGKGQDGHHQGVGNGETLNISDLMKAGGNSSHAPCMGLLTAGVAAGTIITG